MANHRDYRWDHPNYPRHQGRGRYHQTRRNEEEDDGIGLQPYGNYSREQLQSFNTGSGRCEHPRWPKYEEYTPIRWVIKSSAVAFFLLALGSQIGHLVFTIKFVATDNTGYSPDDSSYKLYKNSRFEECVAKTPDDANCTVIREVLHDTKYSLARQYVDNGYTPISSQWVSKDGVGYDWCTFVSCFHGFTVLPSTSQDSTIGLTTFDIWGNINMTALLSLFVFLKRYWNIKKEESCDGLGFWDYIQLAYTIAAGVWWWVDYIQFAIEPVPNTTVSIFEWITTWLLAMEIQYHPFSCVLGKWKKYPLFLLAPLSVIQWGATVHILVMGWSHTLGKGPITQSYDCDETLLPELPGGSNCSAQKLCSDTALLSDPHFHWDIMEEHMAPFAIAYFVISTLVAIQPLFWSFRGEEGFGERFRNHNLGPVLGPVVTAVFVAGGCFLSLYVLVILDKDMDREGPVVADEACSVVHVGLSPWRYYLDIGDFARALRIAKVWFNA
ncbi:hypothetical protein FSARC_12929 [Fusarium sarcochroum]|uniref:Uncharacterized protein n=1 Tax=Fusarium sarcochroum TaxID=1208366 RepID=A0A8H4T523_9HYPO|nr:hypothetical protein FSARC_12929 [Fusarium sarcochroum]